MGEQVLQPSSRAMSITQAPSTRPTSCGSTTFDSATPGAGAFGGHSKPTQQHVASTEPAILWFSQPLHHTPPEVTSVILQARQCSMFRSKAFFHPGSVLFSSPLAGDHTDEGQRGTGLDAEESRLIRNSGAQPMGQSVICLKWLCLKCSVTALDGASSLASLGSPLLICQLGMTMSITNQEVAPRESAETQHTYSIRIKLPS